MSPLVLKIIGLLLIAATTWGLISGRVIAGSRGFRANYYTRRRHFFAYAFFIILYFAIGIILLKHG
jgi:hypothetical protein